MGPRRTDAKKKESEKEACYRDGRVPRPSLLIQTLACARTYEPTNRLTLLCISYVQPREIPRGARAILVTAAD